jgi:vesicular inhibitory amino acid transporter
LGDNLDKLLPGTVVEILGYQVHGKQLFVLAAATVILPTTWLKNLSVLAYLGGRAGLVGCAERVAHCPQPLLRLLRRLWRLPDRLLLNEV